MRVDFPCPFCAEDFDIVGLCRHIDDEHQDEPNSGSGVCISLHDSHFFLITFELTD